MGGKYQISLFEVRGVYKSEHKTSYKILTPIIGRDGYKYYVLRKEGRALRRSFHRLLMKTFVANPQNKPEVNHIDGNKLNNSLLNLEWVTSSENKLHAYKLGLNYYSEKQREANKKFVNSDKFKKRLKELHNSKEFYNYRVKCIREKTPDKISKRVDWFNIESKEEFYGSATELLRRYDLPVTGSSNLSTVARNSSRQYKGWILKKNISNFNKRVKKSPDGKKTANNQKPDNWVNPKLELEFYGTATELANKFSEQSLIASKLANTRVGTRRSHKGWTILKNKEVDLDSKPGSGKSAEWIHESLGLTFSGYSAQLVKKFPEQNLSINCLNRLRRGERKSYKGWRLKL